MKEVLPFEVWRSSLREDCRRRGNLAAFESFDTYVLELLWDTGCAPSVQAILEEVESAVPSPPMDA